MTWSTMEYVSATFSDVTPPYDLPDKSQILADFDQLNATYADLNGFDFCVAGVSAVRVW